MIRLVIAVVLLFLIWVLFVSSFKRRQKIIISVAAVLICIAAVWLDGYRKVPKTGVVTTKDLQVCGVSADHTYRTNFDITLCLKNAASSGTVKRVAFAVSVTRCYSPSDCTVVDRVERDTLVTVPAQQTVIVEQNLEFKRVDPSDEALIWKAEVTRIKATR